MPAKRLELADQLRTYSTHKTVLGAICMCSQNAPTHVLENFGKAKIPLPSHIVLSRECQVGIMYRQKHGPHERSLDNIQYKLFYNSEWVEEAWYPEFANAFLNIYSLPAAVCVAKRNKWTTQRKVTISASTLLFFHTGLGRYVCLAGRDACLVFDTNRQRIAYNIRAEKLPLGQVPTTCHVRRMLASMEKEGSYDRDYSRIMACHNLLVAYLWTPLAGYVSSVEPSINKAMATVAEGLPMTTNARILGVRTGLVYGAVLGHFRDAILEKNKKNDSKRLRWSLFNSATATLLGAIGAVGGGVIQAPQTGFILRDGSKEFGEILISYADYKLSKADAELRMWAQSVVDMFNNEVILRARDSDVRTKIAGFDEDPTPQEVSLFTATATRVLIMSTKDESLKI